MPRFASALILSLFTLVLVGCGGSSFEGDWALNKEEFKKLIMAEMAKEMGELAGEDAGDAFTDTEAEASAAEEFANAMDINLSIKGDGTFTANMTVFGMTETTTGSWQESGGKATLSASDQPDEPMSATIREGNLILSMTNAVDGPEELPMIRVQK